MLFPATIITSCYHEKLGPALTVIPVGETYAFETRIIAPLHLVATKCRDASLRREAVHLLLLSHRREWMGDSLLAGQTGQWIIGIEEEGMEADGYIPEDARCWGESTELDMHRRSARVRCRQNLRGGGWRWRETQIFW